MMMDLFSHFKSPELFNIPFAPLSILCPLLILLAPNLRYLNDRFLVVQKWLTGRIASQMFTPIELTGHKWAVMLTSLLLFLALMNLMGVLPYAFTPTTQLSLNLGLAFPFWLATVLIGFRNQPNKALGHLVPQGSPMLLVPALVIIETLSLLIRPVALGVRLTANLTAGHLLLMIISAASFAMTTLMPPVAVLTTTVLLLLTVLEIGVAVIQAFVFTLLISLYLQENL